MSDIEDNWKLLFAISSACVFYNVFLILADCFTSGLGINAIMFTTKDQDNDARSNGNCAIDFSSGWWHKNCHCSNPNGLYLAGHTNLYGKGIIYTFWLKEYYSLKSIRLMVKKV